MPKPDGKLDILVVDDSEMVLRFARHVLNDLNVEIFTVTNGREALDRLWNRPADLLITDLIMPEVDGFELISRVRGDERYRSPHIIVMTALDQIEDKVKALRLGANDYTVKPLDADEFKARVQSGLREILLKKQLTYALATLDHELKMVATLQRRLLPKSLPRIGRYRSAVAYEPCSRAGGDYYDWYKDGQGRLVVTVADVSGHGASAAVLMAMVRALLKVVLAEGGSAAEAIGRLNRILLDNIGDYADFITIFLGLVDPETNMLNYCSAGHGDMLLVGPGQGELERLPAGGTVLGFFDGTWVEETIPIEPGQMLILYTDGLVEAVDSKGREFGRERLEQILMAADLTREPSELVDVIRAEIDRFTDSADLADDLTIFLIQLLRD